MREAHEVYLAHHWRCPSCRAAGQGYGQRCAEGAGLWSTYTEAAQRERADRESTKQPAPEPPQPDPRQIASDYVPATEGELVRMLERVQHGEALGLSEREADELADRLHARDREGDDRHVCAECGWLRADATGWRCGAIRAPIPSEWVTRQLQRCGAFLRLEPATTGLQPR
jgi:rubredoxin